VTNNRHNMSMLKNLKQKEKTQNFQKEKSDAISLSWKRSQFLGKKKSKKIKILVDTGARFYQKEKKNKDFEI
jgi:transcriptional regulator of acetoin/glycerol metabolism